MDALLVFSAVFSLTFFASYVALTTYVSITHTYLTEWHDVAVGGLYVSAGVVSFLVIGGYSQENFARIGGVNSLVDGAAFLFSALVSTVYEILWSVLVLGIVCFALTVLVRSATTLTDDETFRVFAGFATLGGLFYALQLVGYLLSADTNPDAHFHVLVLLSLLPPVLTAVMTVPFAQMQPEQSYIEQYILPLSGLSYVGFLLALVTNAGIGGVVREPIFRMPLVVTVGAITGFAAAGAVSTRHILWPAAIAAARKARHYASVLLTYSRRTFRHVVILRPKN
jgi:hypothetical protein